MQTPIEEFFEKLNSLNLINFLQENHLVAREIECLCGHICRIQKYNIRDQYIFRCSSCKKTKSIRSNTFFSNSKLAISTIIQLIFFWVSEIPVTMAAKFANVSNKSAIQWYSFCRDICSYKMANLTQLLGGENIIVEIDESLMFKRKNNLGRVIQQHWIFGMYDISLKKGYLISVPNRSSETLLPIIQRWIHASSIIHSDQWSAYNALSSLGFTHATVNHFQNFVNLVNNVTTNHVEAFWCRIKRRLKYICGSQENGKWDHLDEACYRHWYEFCNDKIWQNLNMFLVHISERYPL